jgi:transcriptional regulator
MNKAEIAATLRTEVGELEVLIKKLQTRLERSKRLVLDIEEELAPPKPKTEADSKFRKVIDSVFGEKPKGRKR